MPAWFAAIVQSPAPRIVTVLPETLQTAGVVELNVTGRPEVAVALMVNGGSPKALLPSAPNEMVWAIPTTESEKEAVPAPPGTLAVTEKVPRGPTADALTLVRPPLSVGAGLEREAEVPPTTEAVKMTAIPGIGTPSASTTLATSGDAKLALVGADWPDPETTLTVSGPWYGSIWTTSPLTVPDAPLRAPVVVFVNPEVALVAPPTESTELTPGVAAMACIASFDDAVELPRYPEYTSTKDEAPPIFARKPSCAP